MIKMIMKNNLFYGGGLYEPMPPDSSYFIVEIPGDLIPDLRLHRYDANSPTKMRLATVEELTAYDSATKDSLANQIAQEIIVKALARITWEELQKMQLKSGQSALNWAQFKQRGLALIRQTLDGIEP